MTQPSRAELAAAGRKKVRTYIFTIPALHLLIVSNANQIPIIPPDSPRQLEEFRRQKANKSNAANSTIATAPEPPPPPPPPRQQQKPPIIQQYGIRIKEETTTIPFTPPPPPLDHRVNKHEEPKPSIFGDYFAINPTNISSPSSRQPIKDDSDIKATTLSSPPAPPLFAEPSLTPITTTTSFNGQQQEDVDITHKLIVQTNETLVVDDYDVINEETHESSSSLLHTNPPPAAAAAATTTNRKDDFKALQQHIGELTEEKFMLQRGLEQQAKLAGLLADENERLAERCNEYASEAESLRGQIAELSCEMGRAAMMLEMARGEKDVAVAAASEAGERARAMAAEVVALEEKLLKAKAQIYREKHTNDNNSNINNNGGNNIAQPPLPPPPPPPPPPPQQQQPSQASLVDVEKHRKELEAAKQAAAASQAALTDTQHQFVVLEKERDRLKDKVTDLTSALEYQAQQYHDDGEFILRDQQHVVHTPNNSNNSIAAKSSSMMASRRKEGPPPPSTILSQHLIDQHVNNNKNNKNSDDEVAMMLPPEWICLLPEPLVKNVGDNSNIGVDNSVVQVAESVNALLLAVEKDKRRLIASLHAKQAEIDELESTAALMQAKLEPYQHRLELKGALEGARRGGE